jgi:hypothetical protein
MIAFGDLERISDKVTVAYFRFLYRNPPEETEENHDALLG